MFRNTRSSAFWRRYAAGHQSIRVIVFAVPRLMTSSQQVPSDSSQRAVEHHLPSHWLAGRPWLNLGGRCTKYSAMREGATEDGRAYDATHVQPLD